MATVSTINSSIDCIAIIDVDLASNPFFIETLRLNFNFPIETILTVEDYELSNRDATVIYVSSTFEGPLFELLIRDKKFVISDLIVQECIEKRQALPFRKHALFNHHMENFLICFSISSLQDQVRLASMKNPNKSLTNAHKLNQYLNLIRFMGGQSRRDMKSGRSFERTHLIESTTDSENYRMARVYELPILNKDWIEHVWSKRRKLDYDSSDSIDLAQFRIKPFMGLYVTLHNFPHDLSEEMQMQIEENQGKVVEWDDPRTTHLVIYDGLNLPDYESQIESMNFLPKHFVNEKWITASLHTKYREDESSYELPLPSGLRREEEEEHPTLNKTDASFAGRFNSILSKSAFDQSLDESLILSDQKTTDKNNQKKFAITQELYQTELNYVNILNNILKVFQQPLIKHEQHDELPNDIELKTIFGSLRPIIDVHEKVIQELEPMVTNWSAENEVGTVFKKHSDDFLSAYPQYINFFEKTKESINQCIEKYPKFATFIKASEALPECKKQKFHELLINPIQRLPRIEMYLRALLEKTDSLHPDYKPLNESLITIMKVNSEINSEKKKTEGQLEMFHLLNDIEDCPATLLSANRHFIMKCDVKLFILCGTDIEKLENVFTLLLFSDCLLLCKKRTQVVRSHSLKEKSSGFNSMLRKQKKTLKFIETIEFFHFTSISRKLHSTGSIEIEDGMFSFQTTARTRSFTYLPFIWKDTEEKMNEFFSNLHLLYEEFFDNNPHLLNHKSKYLFREIPVEAIDFEHCHEIVKMASSSKFDFIRKTKKRLNRTLSANKGRMRSSISMENINSSSKFPLPLPSTPSLNAATPSKRQTLTRGLMMNLSFLTPSKGHDSKPPIASRKMGSISNINEVSEDGYASAPTTPAARKKRYDMLDNEHDDDGRSHLRFDDDDDNLQENDVLRSNGNLPPIA